MNALAVAVAFAIGSLTAWMAHSFCDPYPRPIAHLAGLAAFCAGCGGMLLFTGVIR